MAERKKAARRSGNFDTRQNVHFERDEKSIARAELWAGLVFAVAVGTCMVHWAVVA